MQEIIVIVLFIAALIYIIRLAITMGSEKQTCAGGCSKCAAIDFDKIELEINKSKTSQTKN